MSAEFSYAVLRAFRPLVAFLIFAAMFVVFHVSKPAFAYLPSGGFRPFGVGRKRKTVLAAWVIVVVLSIFSYLAVVQYSG